MFLTKLKEKLIYDLPHSDRIDKIYKLRDKSLNIEYFKVYKIGEDTYNKDSKNRLKGVFPAYTEKTIK